MPVFHDSALIGAAGAAVGGGGYAIERGLRFNSADSAYLSRTPASAGTSYTTWTFSCWVKRATLGTQQGIIAAGTNTSDYFHFKFTSSDTLNVLTGENGTTNQNNVSTTAVFRDPSAWYHIVLQWDFTNATQADRLKIYVNGVRQTVSGTIAAQNYAGTTFNRSGIEHCIGRVRSGVEHLNAYVADAFFIDGQALDPTSFGEFSATTGVWMPKAYTGSYGTNGFRLTFADNSAATATTLGKDAAGSNNWTPNNLSVTAGAGNDSLVDVPVNGAQTDTGVGGEVRGNYATLNPLNYTGTVTLSNGNLDATGSNANASSTIAPSSGKWYAEFSYSAISAAVGFVGISNRLSADAFSGATQTWQLNYTNTGKLENAGSQSNVSTFTTGDIIGVAFDCSNGQATFYKNGSSVGTITGSAFVGVPVLIGAGAGGAAGTNTFTANYGARPFAYTAPSGFKALCTANLPAPVITKPSTVFDVKLYTGTGTTNNITGLGFAPDFLWIKSRSTAQDNNVFDAVRGPSSNLYALQTNATSAEGQYGTVGSLNSDGFTLTGAGGATNANGTTYVAWAWDAGSSTVTNNTGTITGAQVRANASAGTSVVAYTGNGTSGATVGHGLGVAPAFIIVKKRSAADDWVVYHSALGATKYLWLHATNAEQTGTNRWNDTAPTSTVFSLGSSSSVNGNASTFIAYCFAPVAGYSAFGSYTGNGSADGAFVYTGHRSRWIMIKRTDTTSNWTIIDTAREGYNVDNDPLFPNLSDAEGTTDLADILSNGFKLRSTDASVNASSGTYVYAAFSEAAFQYSRAR